jgi:hypothetical protein
MPHRRVDLDWTKLLGFEQAQDNRANAALQAKIGDKGGMPCRITEARRLTGLSSKIGGKLGVKDSRRV